MFSRHVGLKIFLLAGVPGQAQLFEQLTNRQEPGWSVGLVLIIGAIVSVLLGEWLADDSVQRRWRLLGWAVAATGAGVHLLLDAACVMLLWLPVEHPVWLLAGVGIAAVVMVIQLVLAVAGLRDPTREYPTVPAGHGRAGAFVREVSLFGGTPIAVTAVGVGMVAMACVGLYRRGWNGKVVWAAAFFLACAVCGLAMGIERRASLLGRPVPWARWLPRFRTARYDAAREGLLLVGRRGAVLYPWEDVESVAIGSVSGNHAVLVTLAPETVGRCIRAGDMTPEGDARWRRRQLRTHGVGRALYGADLVIMSPFTEAGPGPLHARIADVLRDREAARSLPLMTDLIDGRRDGRAGVGG